MKQAYFFIDDFIWTFRDVARQKPASLFDNWYFDMLKRAHDEYGLTVQLNLFYRTDAFYGEDEFTLSEFPDAYKAEWEANADWLKLAFHARQEFPDYPYINADYEEMKLSYERVANEIRRFAGEKSLANAIVPHWMPISKAGCQALYDCGVRYLCCSVGDDPQEYIKWDERVEPHVARRILHKRKPETKFYVKKRLNLPDYLSLCAYNHLTEAQAKELSYKNVSMLDEETGIRFKLFSGGPCLNLYTADQIAGILEEYKDVEYIGCANHEQYAYPEYFNYTPGMEELVMTMAKTLKENGFTFITCEDFN